MSVFFRRLGQIFLILAACFFLFFGILSLISAYQLRDPFRFIMTFFSSSLIILISGALLAGFIVRMLPSRGETRGPKNNENRNSSAL